MYDFYEYRVPTMEDRGSDPYEIQIALDYSHACFMRTYFLSDGSKHGFLNGFVYKGTITDLNTEKFRNKLRIIGYLYSNSKSKSIPLISKRDIL